MREKAKKNKGSELDLATIAQFDLNGILLDGGSLYQSHSYQRIRVANCWKDFPERNLYTELRKLREYGADR